MLLDRLRAHIGQRTVTLTAPGGDVPGVRNALPAKVDGLLREARVGVDRNQGFLREVSAWPEELAVAVLGSPDAMGEEELVDRVIEAAAEHRHRRIDEVVRLIDDRTSAGRVTAGMSDLYAASVAGRIELLVLLDGPPVDGYLTASGHLVAEDPGGAVAVPDVYAFGVAEALRRGAEVLLAPAGALEVSIATLRW